MSTFWTPSGERPIPKDEPATAPPPPAGPPGGAEADMDDEQLQAELRAMQEQMLRTPAAIVVANHCIGLIELAALHLGQDPPHLADAQVAIDALAGILDAVGPRLGDNGPALSQALTQIRMAFVEAKQAAASGGAGTG
ncbi:MAG TPA: hypothetical protein VHF27_13035 [Acidimicrobiales bacterium]|nr:hypothetical protein [Acidimicrobiales bacterium]